MTTKTYQQQLYDACKEHIVLAQKALDQYDAAKTDHERECAKIDNLQHLAAHNALQWALDKTIDIKQEIKQSQIDVLNRVMTYINDKIEAEYGDMSDSVKYLTINIYEFDDFIDELIKEVQNGEDKG